MKLYKLSGLGSALVLGASALLTLAFSEVAHAAGPYTCTWTGSGSDSNFSTAANWSGCNSAAPVTTDNDTLIFPADSMTSSDNPSNDLTGATFTEIEITGTGVNSITIIGNAFTLLGGISDTNTPGFDFIENPVTFSGDQTITTTALSGIELDGQVTDSSTLTIAGSGDVGLSGDNTTITGAITVNAGNLVGMSPNSIGTSSAPGATMNSGSDFILSASLADLFSGNCQLFDFNGNLTLTGDSSVSVGDASQIAPKLGNGEQCDTSGSNNDYGAPVQAGNVNLNGNITLGSDITFASFPATTTITGSLSGAYTINMLPGYIGELVVNSSANTSDLANGTYTSSLNTGTLSDSQPNTDIDIYGNNVITLDGSRGNIGVHDGGTLKGDGTANSITEDQGGIVSPGHSPGCLTTGDLTLNGNYQVEIGGTTPCTGYDQVVASGTVNVSGATLAVSFVNGFTPTAGQTFEIVDNTGGSPVTGRFANLPEGTTLTVSGIIFKISYVGAGGKNIVLTATAQTPKAPNTGAALLTNNPLLSLIGSAMLGGSSYLLYRNYKLASKRR
jgi:fibronectin-binding autotransporter adhesin